MAIEVREKMTSSHMQYMQFEAMSFRKLYDKAVAVEFAIEGPKICKILVKDLSLSTLCSTPPPPGFGKGNVPFHFASPRPPLGKGHYTFPNDFLDPLPPSRLKPFQIAM